MNLQSKARTKHLGSSLSITKKRFNRDRLQGLRNAEGVIKSEPGVWPELTSSIIFSMLTDNNSELHVQKYFVS